MVGTSREVRHINMIQVLSEDQSAEGAQSPTRPLDSSNARHMVNVFKLLADETRLHILFYLLSEKELNVRSLCSRLSQSQPAVSHHLALLRGEGMIECRREGKHNFYFVVPERFESLVHTIFSSLPNVSDSVELPKSIVRLDAANGSDATV